MKNLSKLITVVFSAATLFFTTNANAQSTGLNDFRVGIAAEGGLTTGIISSSNKAEVGGTLRLQYGVSDFLAVTLTSGYYDFIGSSRTSGVDNYPNLGMVPVKLGVKSFFSKNIYFIAEGGAGFVTNTDGHTKLLFSPGLGYATKSWDLGVRYENISGQEYDYGVVALRLAYGFKL